MAKTITQRTLVGYRDVTVNAHYFDDLINYMENKPDKFVQKITKANYWSKGGGKMKFDAVVGNPPYMIMDNGAQASAKPIYNHFVDTGKKVSSHYMSFIIPTRWYAGGKGLDDFRDNMLDDEHLEKIYDFLTPDFIFPNTNIRGGVCFFLWNNNYNNIDDLLRVITYERNEVISDSRRPLKTEGADLFIRYNQAISIIEKVKKITSEMMDKWISPRRPFGIDSAFSKTNDFSELEDKTHTIQCIGKGQKTGYINVSFISSHREWIDKWKVFMPYANNIGTELNDDNLNTFIGKPGTVCTEAYIMVGIDHIKDENTAQNISFISKNKIFAFYAQFSKIKPTRHSKNFCICSSTGFF